MFTVLVNLTLTKKILIGRGGGMEETFFRLRKYCNGRGGQEVVRPSLLRRRAARTFRTIVNNIIALTLFYYQ